MLKWVHVIGATVLLGTGAGIAFFLWRAHRTRDPKIIAVVAAGVVRADLCLTATAVLLQPVTGLLLMGATGSSIAQAWLWQSFLSSRAWRPSAFLSNGVRALSNCGEN